MTPRGVGVDVVDLRRWGALARRNGPRLAEEMGLRLDVMGTFVGAVAFGLVECVVKARQELGLWETLMQARGMHSLGNAVWAPSVIDDDVKRAGLLAVPSDVGTRWGVDALVTTEKTQVGTFAAARFEGHVIVVLRELSVENVLVAREVTTEDEGVRARAVLKRLAERWAPGHAVLAPDGEAPSVGPFAASMAHDGGVVVAALEAAWNR